MDDDEAVSRLTCLYVDGGVGDGFVTEPQARTFLAMWREMQNIDREIAEEQRVAHAREMSQGKRR